MNALFGHSTNLLGFPTGLLASLEYNESPEPLTIAGVREMNPSLFEMLEDAENSEEAALAFETYMAAAYGVDPEQKEKLTSAGPRRFRSSYFRLLRGWGYDSNSPEGAVMKGWVESRFGLFPTFHKQRLTNDLDEAWSTYVVEKMSSRFHNNSIYTQLDLLYEFCQWSLARWHAPGQRHIALYRGSNDFDENQIVARLDRRTVAMRVNNLASFTSDRATASCFGDTILKAHVPTTKILFFNTLLPRHALKAEGEYLVIGGIYRVETAYY